MPHVEYDFMDRPFDVPNPGECVECSGPLILLGELGSLSWYRCEDCGMDQHS